MAEHLIMYGLFKFFQHEQFVNISNDSTSLYTLTLNSDETMMQVCKQLKPNLFIKTHFASYKKITALDGSETCSICLEALTETSRYKRTLPCLHVFHKTCIEKWFKKTLSCPMCRCEFKNPMESVCEISLK